MGVKRRRCGRKEGRGRPDSISASLTPPMRKPNSLQVKSERRKIRKSGIQGLRGVLYRTNAQSPYSGRTVLLWKAFPTMWWAGLISTAPGEIKDMLAYLKTIDNGRDDPGGKARIINVPRRGIGATHHPACAGICGRQGLSFYDALRGSRSDSGHRKKCGKAEALVMMIQSFRSKAGILQPARADERYYRNHGLCEGAWGIGRGGCGGSSRISTSW